jgi:Peptidase family C25
MEPSTETTASPTSRWDACPRRPWKKPSAWWPSSCPTRNRGDGSTVLVADNADLGGPFEADADALASSVLSAREVKKVYVRDLQGGTRAEIIGAFDAGAGLLNYIGHGATAVWASENVFNNTDVATLSAQPQQPLLLTLNCLNGFFHFPHFDSLAEALVKAQGKGAIAAFSPSGLSQDEPAHAFHTALLKEIESGRHARLGDALLAAQSAYADSGAFPELLSVYHLFGDPAQKIR